jgi:HlyD family secretion protein
VNVAVGDLVKAGDVLAVADDTSAELAVRQAEANLAVAKAQQKTDAAGGTATARAQAKDQVTSARTQLSNARSSYSSTVAQNNLKLKQARQAVTDAEAQYTSDKASGAPQLTLDQDKKAITAAEQSLASTKLQAAAGNRQAANQVTSAKQSLTTANRNYKTATTSADDATLIADDVAIAEAEQALADAESALAMATITAPIDGRITVVNAVVGQESTGTAIQLQSTRMALAVSVTEDDILDLAVGQEATVAISATGDTAIGAVTSVSPVASTSGSSTVVSYTVIVTLDEAAGTTAGTPAATGSDAPAVATAWRDHTRVGRLVEATRR